MEMPARKYAATTSYRYGFNGKENDNDVKGEGNSLDFGARMYDPRIGKWFSVDLMREVYTSLSPYSYGANNPINVLDAEGNVLRDKNGNIIATSTGVISLHEIPISATKNKSGIITTQTASMKYEQVKIYTDDGTPIEALRLIEAHVVIKKYDSKGNLLSITQESLSSHGFEAVSDCHGYTFAKGKLWINDGQVNTLLDHDGYTRNTTESKADAVIFKKGGVILHSAVRNKDGTYSDDAGILTLEKNVTLDKASRGFTDVKTPGNVEFVEKKGGDKVVDIKSGSVSGGVRYTTEEDVNKSLPPTAPSTPSATTPNVPKFDFKIPPTRAAANATYVRPPIIPLKKP
jgi:RHS repeat-associated protein